MRKKVFFFFFTIFLLILGTTVVVLYGRGYRPGFEKNKIISGTGLLVATSSPDGAQVFINGKLTSATNDTFNLIPAEYDIEIKKEGYLPWKKKIKIQKEIVAKTDALLFPAAPALSSITSTGLTTPLLDPTNTRIAYKTQAQDQQKSGIYILEMGTRPLLTLQSAANKVADDLEVEFSNSDISFSPNAKFILATVSAGLKNRTTYLLSLENRGEKPQELNVTTQAQLQDQWEKEKEEKEVSRLNSLKPNLKNIINSSFKIIAWSPDDTKILYGATASATIPPIISPPVLGANTQAEEREIKKGSIYVYDIKEDKNFVTHPKFSSIAWYPDSKHLIITSEGTIDILEYDGTNVTTVYAGPFFDNFVAPWPDGSKLVILTNVANSNVAPNLYTVSLK